MITKELIDEINYLSRKSRGEGLSAAEKARQHEVRQIYLAGIRAQVRATLDRVEFVDELPPQSHSCSCGCGKKSQH